MLAAILTIGNELVSGDVENSNASWLARQLERLGVKVVLSAAVPDDLDRIVEFVRREAPLVDYLFVTGGLGGTPDDITREAIAAAFGVGQAVVPELAAELRERFPDDGDGYFVRWAELPEGALPLVNPRGGAPGFRLGNVWVLPGLPSEMALMYQRYTGDISPGPPIATWRRRLTGTSERRITPLLEQATERWPSVAVGSYPSFPPGGPEVEVVLKSSDPDALAAASSFLDNGFDGLA
ncbi:MAG TPA: molybdopterin-binding protein [Gaiellaceae bacterium]|nr:molybdopterin-binding protein [Gaiellaceae bacterium]